MPTVPAELLLPWRLAARALALAGVLALGGLVAGCGSLGGEPRRGSVRIERSSTDAGEIVSAGAEAVGPRGTLVFGRLRNGLGVSDVRDAHIDVRLIGADRRLIAARKTDYFPRPILPEARGRPQRATFLVHLPQAPAAGSTIQVAFHSSRLGECPLSGAP